MKDKKTLITIIVLLVILLPMGVIGTIKNFSVSSKDEVVDDNPNKSFIYKNKLYFYLDGKLLSTYNCSNCDIANVEIDDDMYKTNYYKNGNSIACTIINNYYGIFKENNEIKLYNLVSKSVIDSYEKIKYYKTLSSSKYLITKKSSGYGVIFLDLSNKPIANEYDYISVASHLIDGVLDTSKFIAKKSNNWYILNSDGSLFIEPVGEEIVDFNDNYVITYNNGYHIYDKNKVEYLSNFPKTKVYAIDKYVMVLNNNQLFVYENCGGSILKYLELPSYTDIYFSVNKGKVEINADGNLIETLEL